MGAFVWEVYVITQWRKAYALAHSTYYKRPLSFTSVSLQRLQWRLSERGGQG